MFAWDETRHQRAEDFSNNDILRRSKESREYLSHPSSSHRTVDADRVAAISRLVRKVCLLREQGDVSGADGIESTQLADAVRSLREDSGGEGLPEVELREIYAVERKRVADADALCELLVPRLQGFAPSTATSTPTVRSTVLTVTSSRPASSTEGSPGIPELLDAMLAAERTGRRVSQNTRPKP